MVCFGRLGWEKQSITVLKKFVVRWLTINGECVILKPVSVGKSPVRVTSWVGFFILDLASKQPSLG